MLTRLAEPQALDGATGDALSTIEDALRANPEELVFDTADLKDAKSLLDELDA